VAADDDEPLVKELSDGLQVELFHPDTERRPGDTNVQKWGIDVHRRVFPIACAVIALFIGLTLVFDSSSAAVFGAGQTIISSGGGWFYILVVKIFILTVLYFALSKYGNIRLCRI
jgi:choline/glycine/proline betaine transport protein